MRKPSQLLRLTELRWLLTLQPFEMRGLVSFEGGAQVPATDFIREHTRLYRETWMLPIVDELIEREKKRRR